MLLSFLQVPVHVPFPSLHPPLIDLFSFVQPVLVSFPLFSSSSDHAPLFPPGCALSPFFLCSSSSLSSSRSMYHFLLSPSSSNQPPQSFLQEHAHPLGPNGHSTWRVSVNRHGAPTLIHGAPTLIHGAPTLIHGAPTLIHGAPTLIHGAPTLIHGAPTLIHDAPTLIHSAPTPIHRHMPVCQLGHKWACHVVCQRVHTHSSTNGHSVLRSPMRARAAPVRNALCPIGRALHLPMHARAAPVPSVLCPIGHAPCSDQPLQLPLHLPFPPAGGCTVSSSLRPALIGLLFHPAGGCTLSLSLHPPLSFLQEVHLPFPSLFVLL
ncbi:hypothetical protein BU17DRAFT_86537 [Hysterangium stoloniferum]|nr:hypothetical protein BU17DRAFT_86537 [Hysterangium stoloniferum]